MSTETAASAKASAEQRRRQKLLNAATVSVKAAIRCPLCPKVTADSHGLDNLAKIIAIPTPMTWTNEGEALVAVDEWRVKALAWISDYHDRHGHGPTWGEFRDLHDPDATSLKHFERNRALVSLFRHGYVSGKHIPFGLDVREEDDRQEWLKRRADMNAKRAAKKAVSRDLPADVVDQPRSVMPRRE